MLFSHDNHSAMFAVRSRSPERATRGGPNAAGEGMCFIDGLGKFHIDFTIMVHAWTSQLLLFFFIFIFLTKQKFKCGFWWV